ncbi:MAG: dihydrofolate reductase family protein [Steroidobacteraceae bacterium]|jgi:riboflavin biosynthesis pyrimidine reductase
MKPHVSILMVTSIDGRLHPSRFTASPDGTRRDWSAQYEKVQASLQANAWLVGRVTMAEMSKTGPHAPSGPWKVERPIHVAKTDAATFAVALDPSGKLHFQSGKVSGDHVIVLMGPGTPDSHLAELTADGVSYIVSAGAEFDLPRLLDVLSREFGIEHLVVEGGAKTNGAFLAAQVVDELRILVAPALDGAEQIQGIVDYRNGLAGVVRLTFKSADVLDHGVVQLLYAVLPADA